MWRIYWGEDKAPFSFSKNSLKPWGSLSGVNGQEIKDLRCWVSLNYDHLARIFGSEGEDIANQVKKELRRI